MKEKKFYSYYLDVNMNRHYFNVEVNIGNYFSGSDTFFTVDYNDNNGSKDIYFFIKNLSITSIILDCRDKIRYVNISNNYISIKEIVLFHNPITELTLNIPITCELKTNSGLLLDNIKIRYKA